MHDEDTGMFPGEYMKLRLVKVWPDDDLGDKPPISGRPREAVTSTHLKETRPEFYVAVTRRNDLDWHVEVLKATRSRMGQIPDEVMERLISQRKRSWMIRKARTQNWQQSVGG